MNSEASVGSRLLLEAESNLQQVLLDSMNAKLLFNVNTEHVGELLSTLLTVDRKVSVNSSLLYFQQILFSSLKIFVSYLTRKLSV